jgi:hypothetical protein
VIETQAGTASQWNRERLGSNQLDYQRRFLSEELLRFAIENRGQAHEHMGGARRTAFRAVTHRVAILAKISPTQGNMLHSDICHRLTLKNPHLHPQSACI